VSAEADAAANLVDAGHLVRVWKLPAADGQTKILGLYRADSKALLDGMLRELPLFDWMKIAVTPLGAHPNDPAAADGLRP
jgi:muconolactone D-isomerase